jgi:hypothetical protein
VAGAGCTVAFAGHEVGYQAVEALGGIPSYSQHGAETWIAAIMVVPMVIGILAPSWGPAMERAVLAGHHYRHRRRLYPLWAALVEVYPEVVLTPPSPVRSTWDDRLRWWEDQRWLLYRRAVEIWDGYDQLWPQHRAVGQTARTYAEQVGMTGEDLEAVVEAAAIRVALQTRSTTEWHRPKTVQVRPGPPDAGAADLVAEVAWWAKVAEAFDRSPIVARVAAEVEHGAAQSTVAG